MAPEYDLKEPCSYCFLLNETFIIAVAETGSYDVAQTGPRIRTGHRFP